MTVADGLPLLAAGAAIGFLGSAHCVGMCGGIAGALALAQPPARRHGATRVLHHAACSAGRLGSYATAGALAGTFGVALASLAGASGAPLLRAVAAALMILLGLYLCGWRRGLGWLEQQGARLWRHLAPLAAGLRPGHSPLGAFALGALWGWLPCGLVYSALALAAASGGTLGGALTMLGFGLGTLPALLATGLAAQRLGGGARSPRARRLAGALLIAFGVWTFASSGALSPPDAPCHSEASTDFTDDTEAKGMPTTVTSLRPSRLGHL